MKKRFLGEEVDWMFVSFSDPKIDLVWPTNFGGFSILLKKKKRMLSQCGQMQGFVCRKKTHRKSRFFVLIFETIAWRVSDRKIVLKKMN